jgi:hypothetical protein
MKQPIWYTKAEQFLLDHGGAPLILILLAILVAVSLYFMYQVAHGEKLLPAAGWLLWSWIP